MPLGGAEEQARKGLATAAQILSDLAAPPGTAATALHSRLARWNAALQCTTVRHKKPHQNSCMPSRQGAALADKPSRVPAPSYDPRLFRKAFHTLHALAEQGLTLHVAKVAGHTLCF